MTTLEYRQSCLFWCHKKEDVLVDSSLGVFGVAIMVINNFRDFH